MWHKMWRMMYKIVLSLISVYKWIPVSAKNDQQKKSISFVLLILDDFSMSIIFQISSSVVARPKASLLLAFKNTVQKVLFFV